MARSDYADLSVQIEARVDKLEKSMARANAITVKNFDQMERRTREAGTRMESSMAKAVAGMNSKLANIGKGAIGNFGAFAGASVAGIFGAQGAQAIARYAANYRDLQNALKVTGLEGAKLESTFGALSQIALKQGAPLDALVQLYGRVSQSAGDLKASQADLLAFSDGIATALRVSGKSASEASGALLQLGQALGGSKIQAEEYNSLLDGAYPLLQAVANGLKEAGGSVAKLTALVKDGKVPTEAFFRAALAGFPSIAAQADKAQGTVSQSMSRIGTAMTLLVGHMDEATGSSDNAAKSLNAVADAIQAMPAYFDAAARGLDALRSKLAELGNSDVFVKLNKLLGVDGDAASAEFLRQRSQDIKIPGTDIVIRKGVPIPGGATSSGANGRVGAAFDVTAGTGAESGAAAGKVGRLGAEAQKAQVSLNDFASATDDAAKKAKLGEAPIVAARQYAGLNEGRDNDVLSALFKRAGMNVDPEKTKWCAAFVNAVLATNGVKGTGSLAARSFLNYGEATDKPQTGDIVVLKRGGNPNAGHVGFFEGYDAKGNIRVLGGNQGDGAGGGVNTKSFNPNDVLGYRRIPGVETGGAPGSTVADEIAKRNDLAAGYAELVAGVKLFTAEQQAEQSALGMTAQKAAALRYEQELLAEAQQRGLTLSPQQRAELKRYAEGMAEIETTTRSAVETQAEMQAAGQFLKQGMAGFFTDIITGASSVEEALGRLLASLADAALQAAFLGSGPLGGLFGAAGKGILGAIFPFAEGGIAANGKPQALPRFAKGGVSRSAAIFGEAGPEAAVPLPDGRSIPVTLSMPKLPAAGGVSNVSNQNITIAPNIVVNAAQGGDARANAESARETAKAVEQSVKAIVQKELQTAMRPGGIMRGGR